MMSFYNFTQLSQDAQFDLVFTIGEFIGSKTVHESTFVLYSLYSFFVEVEYHHRTNKLIGIKSFLKAL